MILDENIPKGAFVPSHIEQWAVIEKFDSEVPSVEIDFTGSGGLAGKCYGLTVECEEFFEGERQRIDCKCAACGENNFQPRIAWLGYQVFETGWENELAALVPMRNSFDSIVIDLKCLACGHDHKEILQAETA